MSSTRIGHIVRRLRQDRKLSQQAMAVRLGISASYLNLIEHNQRSVTANLLIKLARTLDVTLETLAGTEEQRMVSLLREALGDPAIGGETIPPEEIEALAAQPAAARTILELHRAFRAARQDAAGMVLPGGTRFMLPHEEARLLHEDRGNYFAELEAAAEAVRAELARASATPDEGMIPPSELNHLIVTRLRQHHGLTVRVGMTGAASRVYDAATRTLVLSTQLPRESRGFQMAFQLMKLEAQDAVDDILNAASPSSDDARTVMTIGLLNYAAACVIMPYAPFLAEATALRYDIGLLGARFHVSYQQAAQRLSTLQRPGARGVPLFFTRVDPAGNIIKSFSACGFPIPRHSASCPQWNANRAFLTPGSSLVDVAQLTDGRAYLCFARTVSTLAVPWGAPQPIHTIAMGCQIERAAELVYGDFIRLDAEPVHIGPSCHLCDWRDCRSRAFAPLQHRLTPAPLHDTGAPGGLGPALDEAGY